MTTPVGQGQQKPTSPINQTKQVFQPTPSTREKAEGAKAYIERKYAKLKNEEKEKKEAWDKLLKQMDKMNLSPTEKELIKQEIQHKEAELFRLSRAKITVRDFDPLKIIGRGAFGEVRVCRNRKTLEVVAIKKMKKTEMIYKNQVAHVRAERDILALAKNDWIVELKCSFQDEKYLYLVMEFLQGGDLMTLLMEKDILSEEESRFYIAETILAVETVHKLDYIHRDLKPDNLLIGKDGHVKLSDFGLCKHVEIKPRSTQVYENLRKDLVGVTDQPGMKAGIQNRRIEYKRSRQLAFSTVGTPDYIAPEVFGQCGYNESVDWWSVGAILFEMLVGYPPFFSDDPSVTCQKILHWRKTLNIPPEANLSPAATDILKRLLCDADHRLGATGVDEIKAHPFFEGLDWNNMRKIKAPYQPSLQSDDDCTRFDKFEEEESFYPVEDKKNARRQRKDINFVGYTYKKDVEEQKVNLVKALNESLQTDTTVNNNGSSLGSSEGGATPVQKMVDTSQNSSNFYMSQIGQGGHNEMTMISNQNISKSNQYGNNIANLKRQVFEDEDEPPEDNSKPKLHVQMANTGYDGFGGAQMKNYYQQPQQQMSSSHYVAKGGITNQQQQMIIQQQQQKGIVTSQQRQAQDLYIKKGNVGQPQMQANMGNAVAGQNYGQGKLSQEQQQILMQQLQKKQVQQQQQMMVQQQQQQQQLAQQKMMLKMGVTGAGISSQQQQPQMSSQQKKFIVPGKNQADQYDP